MSLPAPAPRASDLNSSDMARLSAPANETPKAERKSSRFRGMFKHRPDSSASSSPATAVKSPETIDSSPLASPNVQPGFQQIGLLPSERPSFSSQVNAEMGYLDSIKSAIVEERDEEIGPMMTQDGKTESFIKNAEQNADSSDSAMIDFASTTPGNTQQPSSPPGSPYRFTDNMHADSNMTGADSGSVGGKGPIKSILPPKRDDLKRQTPSLGAEPTKNTDMLDFDNLLERCRTSLKTAHDNFNSLKLMSPVDDYDADSIASESSTGNAADTGFLLHARYREFIKKQIVVAFSEHHRADDQQSPGTRVTINIGLGGVSTAKTMQTASACADNVLFAVNSSIGPFTLTHARIARDLQRSIVAFYMLLLLGSAFLGPKTLALTVWRMAIVLGAYAATACRLGWTERLERDVLLAPVFFAFSVVQGLFAQMAEQIHVVVAGAVADGLGRNGTGEEEHVDDSEVI